MERAALLGKRGKEQPFTPKRGGKEMMLLFRKEKSNDPPLEGTWEL